MKNCSVYVLSFVMLAASAHSFAQDKTEVGTVLEVVDVGNYVYLRLAEEDDWVATAPFAVSVGDMVELTGANRMKNFYSRQLDKTFDWIIFANSGRVLAVAESTGSDQDRLAAAHAAMSADHAGAHSVPAPVPGEFEVLEGGTTVAEILKGYPESGGDKVKLRAKVTKVSPNIMGKNWVTLQDGTGTGGSDWLMATTQEPVSVGDIVIAEGVIATDVSLGYGYDYKVILENAVFN